MILTESYKWVLVSKDPDFEPEGEGPALIYLPSRFFFLKSVLLFSSKIGGSPRSPTEHGYLWLLQKSYFCSSVLFFLWWIGPVDQVQQLLSTWSSYSLVIPVSSLVRAGEWHVSSQLAMLRQDAMQWPLWSRQVHTNYVIASCVPRYMASDISSPLAGTMAFPTA